MSVTVLNAPYSLLSSVCSKKNHKLLTQKAVGQDHYCSHIPLMELKQFLRGSNTDFRQRMSVG